jgi:hypothetical protein
MNDGVASKAYVSDRPRILGLFHFGDAAGEKEDTLKRAGRMGLIAHIGPCKCDDPAHTFPAYYSIAPCVFVRVSGHIITMRIPMGALHAILWLKGTPNL